MTAFETADERLRAAYDEPMSLAEYVAAAREDPAVAAHAARYVLDAIETHGTRTVVEDGESLERYRFFDDPTGDGEHAVLGNTRTLNDLVDDIRAVAAGRGRLESILWVTGPTATGKSELKRCLVAGLRAYSRTEAGRRYTLEWNPEGDRERPGLTYGGGEPSGEWLRAPTQTHPLSVFPEPAREELLADLAEAAAGLPPRVEADLDPVSAAVREELAEGYRHDGREDPFSALADPAHLRVTNYTMELGRGIGVLHAEDEGSPGERLAGSWLPGVAATGEGGRDPRGFTYDGVLAQGNGGLTVVEDAGRHADLLPRLLNVPEERSVAVGRGTRLDLDTLLVLVSNPDLEAHLDRHAGDEGDPMRALKRRLSRHRMRYLTSPARETELLHRELTDETTVWTARGEALADRVRAAVTVEPRGQDADGPVEFAPHALAAAALYAVVTRLDDEATRPGEDLVDRAVAADREPGPDTEPPVRSPADGRRGIPVTFTRDVLTDLAYGTTDRSHPELAVERVRLPGDVLDAMVAELDGAPVFDDDAVRRHRRRVDQVRDRIQERQSAAVLAAVLADAGPSEAAVERYLDGVAAWAEGDPDVDHLTLRTFEVEHVGTLGPGDYDGAEAGPAAREFREELRAEVGRQAWASRDGDFASEVDPGEVPVLADLLGDHDWSDVRRRFPDFDPAQWDDPPAGTETERVVERATEGLVERGYSRAAAVLTGRVVAREVRRRWD